MRMLPSIKASHLLSKLFQPSSTVPKDALIKHNNFTSKSQKLMLEMGVIRLANPGAYHLLPLGVRALEKLIALVDKEMQKIGGQKVVFPTLTKAKLWEKTGRLQSASSELFQVEDRHKAEYILSPTHEEAATELISTIPKLSYKQLPLLLYQITNKYRDEMKPRFGLLRGKQFLMKDMYSFDADIEYALKTYETIGQSYDRILSQIGVDFIKVIGSSGIMGGDLSHEFHYSADIGEDKLIICNQCGYSANLEVAIKEKCPNCKSNKVEKVLGIEIGHTFLLEDKYTQPFNATYFDKEKTSQTLQMGSYGLGLSRIIGAAIEVLSTDQEMRWPQTLAPFTIVIIPPKHGSKEELLLKNETITENLYHELSRFPELENNILVDDRTDLTIGKRFMEAKRFGYPFVIVLGQKATHDPPIYEINDIKNARQMHLDWNDLLSFVANRIIGNHPSADSSSTSSAKSDMLRLIESS